MSEDVRAARRRSSYCRSGGKAWDGISVLVVYRHPHPHSHPHSHPHCYPHAPQHSHPPLPPPATTTHLLPEVPQSLLPGARITAPRPPVQNVIQLRRGAALRAALFRRRRAAGGSGHGRGWVALQSTAMHATTGTRMQGDQYTPPGPGRAWRVPASDRRDDRICSTPAKGWSRRRPAAGTHSRCRATEGAAAGHPRPASGSAGAATQLRVPTQILSTHRRSAAPRG